MKNDEFWTVLDNLVNTSELVIDRPKGSRHPRYHGFVYPVDYGYLKDTSSPDGGGVDFWKGTQGDAVDAVICTVDAMKRDSEIKILIGCSEDEKRLIYAVHNDSEYMKGIMIRRSSEIGEPEDILKKKIHNNDIEYRRFDELLLSGVLALQNEWFYENITFGVIPETADDLLGNRNAYFYTALNDEAVVGYVTAEIIEGNEYNVFPKGASFLRVNDLYVAKEYRNKGIGRHLLSLVEQQAYADGLLHIFVSSAAKDSEAVRNFYTKNGYGIWTTMFYKRKDWDVRVYPSDELDGYRYVVVFARYQQQWLYCRHKERDTYETAGGHIEKGETPLEAAKRELYEETGALKYDIRLVFDYSVHTPDDGFSNGQVFLAEITELGDIPEFEMAEVRKFDSIPEKMRFPLILPVLYAEIHERLQTRDGGENICPHRTNKI